METIVIILIVANIAITLIGLAWIGSIVTVLHQIHSSLKQIQMTQAEAVQKLTDIATQTAKVKTEVEALLVIVQGQDNVSPELQTAIENVQAAIQGVDDLNPDAPVDPPVTQG